MAYRSTGRDPQEDQLPNRWLLFNLISSHNLDAIRSILTPLTLRDRQLIVYRKVDKKTLLYYACELGYRDIVKYLLDECGADIDDCYCDSKESVSPLRVALKRIDIFLMTLLMRHEAAVQENNRTISCDYYAFKMRCYMLMTNLKLYKNRIINRKTVVSNSFGHSSGGISSCLYNTRHIDFLCAASIGDIARMKILLKSGVSRDFQNYEEENALCLAIMNEERNAVNFLINYKRYSLKSYALALELCGAKFIIFRPEKQNGFECWRESVRIRQEYYIGFSDKNQVKTERDLGIEFQTEDEIDRLQNENGGGHYFQALLVFLRLLPKCNRVTQNAFVKAAESKVISKDLLASLKILSELYYFPTNSIRSPTSAVRKTLIKLFDYHFTPNFGNTDKLLGRFRKLVDFLHAGIWDRLLRFLAGFHRLAYGELLDLVVSHIDYMESHDLTEDEKQEIENEIRKISRRCYRPYPTTLVHRAIQKKYPLSVVSYLLKCSAGANSPDFYQTTPLHLISRLPKDDPYLYYMTDLLIEAGAHIDAVNCLGKRPLEALKRKGVIENPLQFLSLQCLAAQAIAKSGIVVSEKNCPKILVKFVQFHSSSPP